jgi:hypothetical protein
MVTESGMPNGIHTAMNAVQAASLDAVRDCAWADPAANELRPRDNAVLIASDASDQAVPARFVAFVRHIRPNATKGPISPPASPGAAIFTASSHGFAP